MLLCLLRPGLLLGNLLLRTLLRLLRTLLIHKRICLLLGPGLLLIEKRIGAALLRAGGLRPILLRRSAGARALGVHAARSLAGYLLGPVQRCLPGSLGHASRRAALRLLFLAFLIAVLIAHRAGSHAGAFCFHAVFACGTGHVLFPVQGAVSLHMLFPSLSVIFCREILPVIVSIIARILSGVTENLLFLWFCIPDAFRHRYL